VSERTKPYDESEDPTHTNWKELHQRFMVVNIYCPHARLQ